MRLKKLIAALISVAVALSLTMPALAASSFRDIEDSSTAVDAEVLRLMGVVGGVGGNYFKPEANLTRAEFCTMAVRLIGRADEAANHTNRTIFSDVTARHWGRSYINLAASITVGDGSTRLIAGVGDGRFLPDEPITYAQAVTILMRVLGYTDQDAGAIWPDGYLKLAGSVKLTDGLELSAQSPLLRAQAVELFANLLSTTTSGGALYYTTLGSVMENVLILDADASSGDGAANAIRTSNGLYYTAADTPAPIALQGYRGTLVLNERKEIITFIPDGSSAVTITLGGDAQSAYLKDKNGTRYTIASETPVYTEDGETTFSKAWLDLRSGSQVTLYLEKDKVIGLYYAAGSAAPTEAYVVTTPVNDASFYYLTGGASGYTILKDGQPIQLGDIQLYDVVTYHPAANTLQVSDLRLPFVYEHASPNPQTPETITVLGHEFPVLASALESISQFKIGDSAVLLLTADGSVAGMVKPGTAVRSTAVGIAGSAGVDIPLPNGGTVTLSGSVDELAQGKLVTAHAEAHGKLVLSLLPALPAPGDLDLKAMTLGSYQIAAGAEVYEQVSNGALFPLRLGELEMSTIPSSQIVTYQQNTSGLVDLLVIDSLTGDAYTYGLLKKGTHEHGAGGLTAINSTVTVVNGSGGSSPAICNFIFKEGDFGGVAATGRWIVDTPVAAEILKLTALSGIKRSDFFQKDGAWYVNAGGTVYPVAHNVEGYIKAIDTWFTQTEGRLEAIRTYSDDMTLYIDPIGYKVRIIVAN